MIIEIYNELAILEKIIEQKVVFLINYAKKPKPNIAYIKKMDNEIINLTNTFNIFEKYAKKLGYRNKLQNRIDEVFKKDPEANGIIIQLIRKTGKGGPGFIKMMYDEAV